MEIFPFDRRFDRSLFSCGKPDLDDWLKTQAGQQERANNARTFLAVDRLKVHLFMPVKHLLATLKSLSG